MIEYLIQYGPWCVLCFYLLFRFEKKLGENTKAIINMTILLNDINQRR